MNKRILICTDGSQTAQAGVARGLELAKDLGAATTIVTVTEPYPYPPYAGVEVFVPEPADLSGYEATQKQSAEKILAGVLKSAAKLGVKAKPLHIADAFPAEAIVEAAKDENCDFIVMSSHGRRGIRRLILGSETAEVLAASSVPVLVVR